MPVVPVADPEVVQTGARGGGGVDGEVVGLVFARDGERAVGEADLEKAGGLRAGEVAQTQAGVNRGDFLAQRRGEQEVAAGERDGGGFEQEGDVGRQRARAELAAAPDRAGAAGGVVVAGQQEDGDSGKIGEGAQGFVDQRVGDEVVLEQIARYEEGVHRAVRGRGSGRRAGSGGAGARRGSPSAPNWGETRAELPVGGVDEAKHCGRRKAEGGRRKAEGGGRRKAEGGRRRKAEGGRRRAEGGRWKAEGGGRRAEGGRRKAEGGGRRAEGGGRRAEGRKAEGGRRKAEGRETHVSV